MLEHPLDGSSRSSDGSLCLAGDLAGELASDLAGDVVADVAGDRLSELELPLSVE